MATSQQRNKAAPKERAKGKNEKKQERLYDDRSNKEAGREAQLTSGGRGPTEGDPAMGINYLVADHSPERAAPRKMPK